MADEKQIKNKVTLTSTGLSVARPSADYSIEREFTIDEIRKESITLLYGESGMGKTTLARQWTTLPLFVLMRGGNEHRPTPLLGTKLPYIEMIYRAQLDAFIMQAQGKIPNVDGQDVTAIVMDQLSSWHNLHSDDILTNIARERDNNETMAQNDWGQVRKRLHRSVADLNRIPIHKLYLAIAKTITNQKGDPVRVEPYVPGQLVEDFMQFSDFVFFLTTENVSLGKGQMQTQRVIYTQPGDRIIAGQPVPYLAKDSTGKLPAKIFIPDPTFPLFEKIMEYLK